MNFVHSPIYSVSLLFLPFNQLPFPHSFSYFSITFPFPYSLSYFSYLWINSNSPIHFPTFQWGPHSPIPFLTFSTFQRAPIPESIFQPFNELPFPHFFHTFLIFQSSSVSPFSFSYFSFTISAFSYFAIVGKSGNRAKRPLELGIGLGLAPIVIPNPTALSYLSAF